MKDFMKNYRRDVALCGIYTAYLTSDEIRMWEEYCVDCPEWARLQRCEAMEVAATHYVDQTLVKSTVKNRIAAQKDMIRVIKAWLEGIAHKEELTVKSINTAYGSLPGVQVYDSKGEMISGSEVAKLLGAKYDN